MTVTKFVRSGDVLQRVDHYNALDQKINSLIFERDAQDRIIAVYDPTNLDADDQPTGPAALTYDYDVLGNLVRVHRLVDESNFQNPVYQTSTYLYENILFPHYLTGLLDPRGIMYLRMEYDEEGRYVATIDADGNRVELQHDPAARTETFFDRQGHPMLLVYDDLGNVVSATDALGRTTTRTYDANDNETSMTDPLGHRFTYMYDASGNLLSETDPLTNTTTYTYDAFGNRRELTDPLGHTLTWVDNPQGNLVSTIDMLGQRMEYNYDVSGSMVSIRDVQSNITSRLSYDISGNMTGVRDIEGFTHTLTYDGAGNQTRLQYDWVNPENSSDIRQIMSQSFYDAQDRVIKIVHPDGLEVEAMYNEIGQVTEGIDRLGNRTFNTYDARGSLDRNDVYRRNGHPHRLR